MQVFLSFVMSLSLSLFPLSKPLLSRIPGMGTKTCACYTILPWQWCNMQLVGLWFVAYELISVKSRQVQKCVQPKKNAENTVIDSFTAFPNRTNTTRIVFYFFGHSLCVSCAMCVRSSGRHHLLRVGGRLDKQSRPIKKKRLSKIGVYGTQCVTHSTGVTPLHV